MITLLLGHSLGFWATVSSLIAAYSAKRVPTIQGYLIPNLEEKVPSVGYSPCVEEGAGSPKCRNYMTLVSLLKMGFYDGLLNIDVDVTAPDNLVSPFISDFQNYLQREHGISSTVLGAKGTINNYTYSMLVELAKTTDFPDLRFGDVGVKVAQLFTLLSMTGSISQDIKMMDLFSEDTQKAFIRNFPHSWHEEIAKNITYNALIVQGVKNFVKKFGLTDQTSNGTVVNFYIWRQMHDPGKIAFGIPREETLAIYQKEAFNSLAYDLSRVIVGKLSETIQSAIEGGFTGVVSSLPSTGVFGVVRETLDDLKRIIASGDHLGMTVAVVLGAVILAGYMSGSYAGEKEKSGKKRLAGGSAR